MNNGIKQEKNKDEIYKKKRQKKNEMKNNEKQLAKNKRTKKGSR